MATCTFAAASANGALHAGLISFGRSTFSWPLISALFHLRCPRTLTDFLLLLARFAARICAAWLAASGDGGQETAAKETIHFHRLPPHLPRARPLPFTLPLEF